MSLDQIEKEVRKILVGQTDGIVAEDFHYGSDILKASGNDLFELGKALMIIEDRFKIEFEQSTEIVSITIEDIIEHIEKRQKYVA
jgi:uncharacterized protein YxjI